MAVRVERVEGLTSRKKTYFENFEDFRKKFVHLERNSRKRARRDELAESLVRDLERVRTSQKMERFDYKELMEMVLHYLYSQCGQTVLAKRMMLENYEGFRVKFDEDGQKQEGSDEWFENPYKLRYTLRGRTIVKDLERYRVRKEFDFKMSADFLYKTMNTIQKQPRESKRANGRVRQGHAQVAVLPHDFSARVFDSVSAKGVFDIEGEREAAGDGRNVLLPQEARLPDPEL